MSISIKTPELPESVDEATLLTWHADPNSHVNRDDKIADVETDKIVLEVFAPADGILKTKVAEGDILKRGDLLAELEESSGDTPKAPASKPVASSEDKSSSSTASKKEEPREEREESDVSGDELKGLSPSVRKLMQEHNIHPKHLSGSGKGGRITRQDVQRFLDVTPEAKKNLGLGSPGTGIGYVGGQTGTCRKQRGQRRSSLCTPGANDPVAFAGGDPSERSAEYGRFADHL